MTAAAAIIGIILLLGLAAVVRASGPAPEGGGPLPSGAAPAPLPGGHSEYDGLIRSALRSAGFEPTVVDRYAVLTKAIIEHESHWDPAAVFDAGCPDQYRFYPRTQGWCSLGLGQVHRGWNPDLALAYDLMTAAGNIAAMAVILARLRAALGDDPQRIAAGYNGGQAMGEAWPTVPAAVQEYVARVNGTFALWAGQGGLA